MQAQSSKHGIRARRPGQPSPMSFSAITILLDGCRDEEVFWHLLNPADLDRVRMGIVIGGQVVRGSRLRPVWAEVRTGSIADLRYFDQELGERYYPYVIEPSGGATRGTLVYLIDAYSEETRKDAKGEPVVRTVLKLHPRLAPIKVGVFPLVKKDGMPEKAREIVDAFFKAGINCRYDEQHAIGRRYARHDEAGTPYCITVDGQTLTDQTVTIRDRDTMTQDRVNVSTLVDWMKTKIEG